MSLTSSPVSVFRSNSSEADCRVDMKRPLEAEASPQTPVSRAASPSESSATGDVGSTLRDGVLGDSEIISVASLSDSDSDREIERNLVALGLDRGTLGTLSRQLGVPLSIAPIETLAYSLMCKHRRGDELSKLDALDVWDALPKKYKLRDGDSPGAVVTVFGANPRNTKKFTKATSSMPHAFEFFCSFVKSLVPGFKFSCLAVRENCQRGPHRDVRNIDQSLVIRLTTNLQGGGLWVADSQGEVLMSHKANRYEADFTIYANLLCFRHAQCFVPLNHGGMADA